MSKSTELTQAKKLVERMSYGFIDGQDAALEFLDGEKWTPLKYKTCHSFWSAKMSHVETTPSVMIRAAYIMIDEGLTARRLAGVIKGLTPGMAVALIRQKENGLSADEAGLTSKEIRPRGRGSRLPTVFIHCDSMEQKLEWDELSASRGTTTDELAKQWVVAGFKKLRKRG